MEALNQSILQSFQSLSVSLIDMDFGSEFVGRRTPEEIVATINQYLKQDNCHKIRKFQLLFSPYDAFLPDIKNWITFIVAKEVEELDLDFSVESDFWTGEFSNGAHSFELPACIFHCKSLTKLHLTFCDFNPPSNFSGFNCLHSLSLDHVTITEQTLHRLIASCPLLECLSLMSCSSLTSITISDPELRLRRFSINNCWYVREVSTFAPNLLSFIFNGEITYNSEMISAPSLVDACIYSLGGECSEYEHDYLKVLSAISHVKTLTVCGATLMRVTHYEEVDAELFPIRLNNLKELQLVVYPNDLSYIYNFFRLCPSPFIEKLFIQLSRLPEGHNQCNMAADIQDPTDVVFNHLIVIKLTDFTGTENDVRLVRFFLESAPLLHYLVLVTPEKSDTKYNMEMGKSFLSYDTQSDNIMDTMTLREQLTLLPKSSPNANILLLEYLDNDNTFNPTHVLYYDSHVVKKIL